MYKKYICIKTMYRGGRHKSNNPCNEIFLDYITKDVIYQLKFDCTLDNVDYYAVYSLKDYYVGVFALDIDEYFISLADWREKQIDEILEC